MPQPDRRRLGEYAAKGRDLGLRTLNRAPEQQEARALASTGTPSTGGPRVLILSPRGWSFHLQVEGTLGQALAERGAEVHVLTCGGDLPICDRKNTWQGPPLPCTSCTRYTAGSVTAHGHRHHQLKAAWEADPGDGLPELDGMVHFGANDTTEPVIITATLLTESDLGLSVAVTTTTTAP